MTQEKSIEQPTPSQSVDKREGYKLVPEKANSIMMNQGADMLRELQNKLARTRSLQDIVDMVYTRMIQAAPKLSKLQPTSQGVDAERLQARIDALMFEYCPNEMTQEQIAAFEKHQVLVRTYGL